MLSTKPLLLLILDGWGHEKANQNNAISQAKTPTWNALLQNCPHTLLSASGLDVGLPDAQMGNSEVGHMTIGSGRVIYQDLTKINLAIRDGSFFNNSILLHALQNAKANNKSVHILGLLSPGGVHSHEDQIAAMLLMAQQQHLSNIYLHAFLDGRDTPPKSALNSLQKLQPHIASIMGRFFAMDRDQRQERIAAAIDLLVHDKAPFSAGDPIVALQQAYARGESDEFVQPTIIQHQPIKDGDTVIFMNFRADRARQLCQALLNKVNIQNTFVTLTQYDQQLNTAVAFPPQPIKDTLTEILSQHNLTQLHVAETEKYAHVTFFFNAGQETVVPGEFRILIPSPQVATYDLQPEMSIQPVTNILLKAIEQKQYDFIVCNFANADMVGHTGNMQAAILAIEAIDQALQQITTALKQSGGQMFITADHGNVEQMWDSNTAQAHTAHTTNLVPLLYFGPQQINFKTDRVYGLQDIAPTLLKLLNIDKPESMTGTALIS